MQKTTIVLISALVWLAGGVAGAETITVSNSTSVQSNTSSSASTGGNTVGGSSSGGSGPSTSSGQAGSVTTGNASASSESTTHVDGSGGTVEAHVEAEANGVKEEKTVTQDIKSGEPVEVEVRANASSGGEEPQVDASVEVRGWDPEKKEEIVGEANAQSGELGTEATTSEQEEQNDAESNAKAESFLVNIVANVSVAVKSVFAFFRFW